jgi:hypothetical protein
MLNMEEVDQGKTQTLGLENQLSPTEASGLHIEHNDSSSSKIHSTGSDLNGKLRKKTNFPLTWHLR